ncbi:MAG: hypothetical protein MRY83_22030 [Flavobacteriales bacterium]|nr:hypothetical protein [Flavobacteriales bacterium]
MKNFTLIIILVFAMNVHGQEEQSNYKSHRILGVLGYPVSVGIQYEYDFLGNKGVRFKTSCEIRRREFLYSDLVRGDFSNEIGWALHYHFKPFYRDFLGLELNFGFFTNIGKSPIQEEGTLIKGRLIANQYLAPQCNMNYIFEFPSNFVFKIGIGYPNALNASLGIRF